VIASYIPLQRTSCVSKSRNGDSLWTPRFTPEHAFFVVEISESSLAFDRKIKLPRYAACGTPEVWIEDLQHDVILVFRDLENGAYKTSLTLHREQSVSSAAFPDVQFKVEDLLG
jgi:Uma2 family endonuclease